jgi:hypothetical protein
MSNVTDEEIALAFVNTNFGRNDHRKLLETNVMKRMADFHCGHAITVIMRKLKLIGATNKPTKKGKVFVADAYLTVMQQGG